MGKTIRFNENGLIAIKNKLNEITAGNDDVVSLNEVRPECDAFYLGMEPGGGPGLYCHAKEKKKKKKKCKLDESKEVLQELKITNKAKFKKENHYIFIIYRGNMLLSTYAGKREILNFLIGSGFKVGNLNQRIEDWMCNYAADLSYLVSDIPYLIAGYIRRLVFSDNRYLIQVIPNEGYDVLNSNEFYQLVRALPSLIGPINYKKCIIKVGNQEVDKNEIINNRGQQLPSTWYHGTRNIDALGAVLGVGIKPTPEKSVYNVKHNDTVFVTSDLNLGEKYAKFKSNNTYDKFPSPDYIAPCVLVVDGAKLDVNRVVFDFDVYGKYKNTRDDELYNDIIDKTSAELGNTNAFEKKGNFIDDTKNPMRFSKIGYRGVIHNNAIIGVIIDGKELSKEQFVELMKRKNVTLDSVKEDRQKANRLLEHHNESKIPQEFIDKARELMPNRFSNWVVMNLNDVNLMPQYFEKRSKALEYYKWMKMEPKNKAVIVNLDESIDFNKNGLSINDDKILDKYNLKDLILSKNGNYVTLNKIVANEFGKGNGSRFMEELTKIADENGWVLALTPDTSFGGTSVGRLKNFYKRFGFKSNKGRDTDFNTMESMVRKPLNENKYDDLLGIYNTNRNISDYNDAIIYFKELSDKLTEKMSSISNKYNCKPMFFIINISQGAIQADQNDVNEFCRLGDERREIEEKIKKLKDGIKRIETQEKEKKEREERFIKNKKEEEENDRIFSLVIDEYGTTKSIASAEYILPDGTMLHSGGDHRGIASVYDVNNISISDDTYRYNYVVDFLNRGAIRCRMFENGSILDMTKEPTDTQYSLIKTFVRYAGGTVDIDFTDSKGDPSYSVSYSNASPQQVVADIYKYYNEGIKPQGNKQFESKENKKIIIPEDKLGIIKENIESEVESSEVDLSSFRKRDTLPPKIWKDEDTLDSRVRLKLLDIADDFWEFVNLTWVEPKGIIMTGSMCNFNWSEFSDIDLHLIVDFNEVDEKKEFVKQYLDSKKNEWNNEHEGLKIMGFPVELYVQDVDDNLEAGGIYDLEENAWIRKPNSGSIKSIGLDKFSIKDKAAEIMTIIDDMYNVFSNTDDSHKIEEIGDDAHYLWDKVKDLRKKSLDKHGESGPGNIVYKVLRRTGYLDKLFKLFSKVYDRSNSISENVKKYLTVLKEEVAMDGSSEGNPYAKRWKEERDALKNFIANYGKLMQSKEDNKMGKLYKVYYDKTMSELIGYNYCICVQWDEIEMKPGSTVYIRALDKFTPFIRRNLQFDDRGRDNVRGNYDDMRY